MEKLAFLFDNDGVLIDSSEFHWRSWQLLMEEEPDLSFNREQFVSTFGKRNETILKQILPHVTEERGERLARRKEELFRQEARGKVSLLPGIEAFLKKVEAARIPHIIASSTPVENLEMYLTSTVLGSYFTHYMSAEEVAYGKPAPDVFIAAAHRLGFEPTSCIAFEDAPAGLQAAQAAGCFVVALATSHRKEKLIPYDLFYPSPLTLDLQEIIDRFNVWKKQTAS